jgi:hypothetical protein
MIDFKDPYNPTEEEITSWAFDPEGLQPVQDWDLMVTRIVNGSLLLKLAGDTSCPQAHFFLRCLYLLVGDAVRSKWNTAKKSDVLKLLNSGARHSDPKVQRWAMLALDLTRHPEKFNYPDWCDGGLAGREA